MCCDATLWNVVFVILVLLLAELRQFVGKNTFVGFGIDFKETGVCRIAAIGLSPTFNLSQFMATLLYNSRPSLRPSRALSTMLADMLRDPQPAATPQPTPAFTPAADIMETAAGFELHLALPGVKKEAVSIEFLDGQLVISGSRPTLAAAKEAAVTAAQANADEENIPAEAAATPRFRRIETNYGSFSRSFRLPDSVNVKAIGAELTDGILRLTLPFDTDKITRQHIAIR